jgi:ADP-ribosyl-[dinitrogen reductase] hydrolase
VRWWRDSNLSCTGRCFDIGITVSAALSKYTKTGDPFSGSVNPRSAGNGSLMRLAPVPLAYRENLERTIHYAGESSRTTHGAPAAVDACKFYTALILGALEGWSKEDLLSPDFYQDSLVPEIAEIAAGSYREKNPPQIVGSGYVVKSLEAAVWAFYRSSTFQRGALLAANLGDDADTTAAVFAQLAGAFYGAEAIPESWLERLAMREFITEMADSLGSFRSACTSGISLMKTIALIDPGRRFPESAWGSSFLRHGTVKEAFAAKDAFQKAAAFACPLVTLDGVKVIDVVWIGPEYAARLKAQNPVALEHAPEICVEVLSSSNSKPDMEEKRTLYFEAGAQEVWICRHDGKMEFYTADHSAASRLCPIFPGQL